MLPTLLSELHVSEDEQNQFMDLVYLSRESWPNINSYITSHPSARKFILLAKSKGLKDGFVNEVQQQIEFINKTQNENSVYQNVQIGGK